MTNTTRYQETLDYLYTMLPIYQRVGKVAYKKDLANTLALLGFLDNPHKRFKSIHIAGTNGKGTSAHGLAAILQSAGYKTGLYTSPHLKNFTERIRINGKEIPQEDVVEFVALLQPAIDEIRPSFFEVTVAMAFWFFALNEVDIAVVETGLGGRLDSTNVIVPEVSLITTIGLDHTDMLGDTLERIAFEKAGIIKEGVPVVIGEYQEETYPVFEKRAKELHAELFLAEGGGEALFLPKEDPFFPDYFRRNTPGIQKTIEVLQDRGWVISGHHIKQGFACVSELTGLKGRFQVVEESPLVIADVSHNREGLVLLFEQVARLCQGKLHVIFAVVKDKNLGPVFDLLPRDATYYWTTFSVPRALPVSELQEQALSRGVPGVCFDRVNEALEQAKLNAEPKDMILVTGSTFVVAELGGL